jgi:hypothetical protein
MITVTKLSDVHPGLNVDTPSMRTSLLAHAGLQYLRAACLTVHNQAHPAVFPFNFLLPTMHQTVELLVKAVAFHAVPGFDPKKYSHRIRAMLRDHAVQVPIFATMLSDRKVVILLKGLENSYLGVRYAECHVAYDGDAWPLFLRVATDLIEDLDQRTKLPFLTEHLQHDVGKQK